MSKSTAYIGSYPDGYSVTSYSGSYPNGYPSGSLMKVGGSPIITAWSSTYIRPLPWWLREQVNNPYRVLP